MRDDLTFADRLHRDLREVRWPEAAELRDRARRRSRRTAVVAATAVLVVASASAAVAGRPGASTPPTVAASEPTGGASAEIPTEALLSETDLPEKADTQLGDSGLGEPVQPDSLLETCAKTQGIPAAPVTSRYSRSRNLLRSSEEGQQLSAPRPLLTQDVYRMEAGTADRVFTELDRFVALCGSWRQTTPVQRDGQTGQVSILHRWRVVDRDFAGDRAVLLRHIETPTDPGDQLVLPNAGEDARVVVQVGDLVTVITPEFGTVVHSRDAITPRAVDAQLRELGRTAADRMCVAANPRC